MYFTQLVGTHITRHPHLPAARAAMNWWIPANVLHNICQTLFVSLLRILFTQQRGRSTCVQIVPNFRVRTIPVLGTMPSIFGMAAASYILCQLAQLPFQPEPIFKLVEGQYQTQLQRLAEREDLVYGNSEGPAVDLDDVRSSSQLGCSHLPVTVSLRRAPLFLSFDVCPSVWSVPRCKVKNNIYDQSDFADDVDKNDI